MNLLRCTIYLWFLSFLKSSFVSNSGIYFLHIYQVRLIYIYDLIGTADCWVISGKCCNVVSPLSSVRLNILNTEGVCTAAQMWIFFFSTALLMPEHLMFKALVFSVSYPLFTRRGQCLSNHSLSIGCIYGHSTAGVIIHNVSAYYPLNISSLSPTWYLC